MDDPILRQAGATTQYYHADGLGSVVAMSDQSGATLGTQRYDAWGKVLAQTGAIPRYGYTGREPDETGLVYYRARYYDPGVGRFTSRDPIGLNGGINPYAYVGNNPVNLTDPFGDRPLTEGEIAMLKPIFNNPNPDFYKSIDVQDGANWNPIAAIALYVAKRPGITLGNTIYIQPTWYTDNYSGATVDAKALLVHETAHVWQKQTDPNYHELKAGWEGLTQGTDAYKYQLSPGNPSSVAGPAKPLALYGYEQQATIVEHYFLATQGVDANLNPIPIGLQSEVLYSYQSTVGSAGLGPQQGGGLTGNQSLGTFTQPPLSGHPK